MSIRKKSRNFTLFFLTISIVVVLTSDVISVNTTGKGYHSLDFTKNPRGSTMLLSDSITSTSNNAVLNIWSPYSASSNQSLGPSYWAYPSNSEFGMGFTKENQTVNFPFYDIVFSFSDLSIKIENSSTQKVASLYPSKLHGELDNAVGHAFSSSIPYNGYFFYESTGRMLKLGILLSMNIITNFTGGNHVLVNLTVGYTSTISGFYLPPNYKEVSMKLGLFIDAQNYSMI